MLLSLPVFAPEVPVNIDLSAPNERHLRLALAMSKLDMVSDEALAGLRGTRLSASDLRKLIEAGWKDLVGKDFEFKELSAGVDLVIPSPSDEEFYGDGDVPLIGMMLLAGQPEWIAVGAAMEAIEAAHPGLGRTCLNRLETVLCHFGIPHTPSGCFEMAQQLHWYGENDETVVMEEVGEEDMENYDIPRRAVIFDGVPEWAYVTFEPEKTFATVDAADFPDVAAKFSDAPFGKFLAAVQELYDANADKDGDFFPAYEDYNANFPPIVFGWSDETTFDRVFDENYRMHMEGESAPWAGFLKFPATVDGIRTSLVSIRHTARVLQKLDAAIHELRKLNDVIRGL